jgi:hypothetical protein
LINNYGFYFYIVKDYLFFYTIENNDRIDEMC